LFKNFSGQGKLNTEKILVTSALPYANGPIHLGHLAGAYLPADIYVRYQRLKGKDIVYVCGSDEHGVAITITADKENKKPKEIIDRFHNQNLDSFRKFGMSFDIYSRTSTQVHHKTAREFFTAFYEAGLFREKNTLQLFDEKANKFLPDRYVEGICPNCGFEGARGDECENCSANYEQTALINPKSKLTGETPVLRESYHWFFPLDEFQKRLEEYVETASKKYHWKENVLNQVKSWFKDGLKERSVTRDLDWGVSLPLEEAKGKVLYVWFEAVLGYISATKELFESRGEPEKWKEYWQNPDTRYLAFIGKDNIVFHTIIFPAMLMAWNDNRPDHYILPENVPANEYLIFEGRKFSKSRGWGVYVGEFLEKFPADPLRYCLAANSPETKDASFYWKEFQMRNNSELADILGNFINRTLTFTSKNFDGEVPEAGKLEEIDREFIEIISKTPEIAGNLFEQYKVKDALTELMNLARAGNKYFNDSEPWKSVRTDKERCATTINLCIQAIYSLAILFEPVLPFSSERLLKILNAEKKGWDEASKLNLAAGHKLGKAEILFGKIEDKVIDEEIARFTEEPAAENVKLIEYDDFAKIDLRVAEIYSAERIKKSEKLLKLQVRIGKEKRQVVAGIAKFYDPETLVGKKIIIVANLKPAKLFGLESQGMVLAAEDSQGKLQLVELSPDTETSARVK